LEPSVRRQPARERDVLQAHYYEQREFQDIAAVMGISKGRVSQLHARALAQIREWLNARPKIDRNL
jgi:RNA polymerase sigma factor FliA